MSVSTIVVCGNSDAGCDHAYFIGTFRMWASPLLAWIVARHGERELRRKAEELTTVIQDWVGVLGILRYTESAVLERF
jgi:hypothetical protein